MATLATADGPMAGLGNMDATDATNPRAKARPAWLGTLLVLHLGYAGYYLCRANFSVSLPLLRQELVSRGSSMSDATLTLGRIAALGVLAYGIAKFGAGALADRLGGRRSFLLGMGGAILATIAFGLSGSVPLFAMAWLANRAAQSIGWPGLVRTASGSFPASKYGTLLGILSLSYLVGDAASRWLLGSLMGQGYGWRQIFFVSASGLAVIFCVVAWVLRRSEAPAVPVHDHEASAPAPIPLEPRTAELFRDQRVYLVCILSLGLTLARSILTDWTPLYYVDRLGMSVAEAAGASAWFPLWGGVAVLVAGFASDRLGARGNGTVTLGGLVLAAVALGAVAWMRVPGGTFAPVAAIAVAGIGMMGPYSLLAGAIALDLGGKKRSATISGIVDGVGYLGGAAGQELAARAAGSGRYEAGFLGLTVVMLIMVPVALLLRRAASLKSRSVVVG